MSLCLATSIVSAAPATTLNEKEQAFKERYQAQFDAFRIRRMQEFAAFKAQYYQRLEAYRSGLLQQWGEVDTSDETTVVEYVEPEVKAVVDFENQQIVVSILHDKDDKPDMSKVIDAINALQKAPDNNPQSQSVLSSYAAMSDAVAPELWLEKASVTVETPEISDADLAAEKAFLEAQGAADQQQLDIMADSLSNPSNAAAKQLKQQAERASNARLSAYNNNTKQLDPARNRLTDKRITRVTLPIKPKNEMERIASIRPFANEFAKEWDLPLALVVAIIDTESSFNPRAVSHVPAYGLMQVVPHSAGIDINEFLHDKREPLDKDYLFIPGQNVQAGSAYLYILDSRYLKQINDTTTRLYCVISAYNTGVGNVAKALSKGQHMRFDNALLDQVNAMSSDAVYDMLRQQLPYEETRRYLQKVRSKMEHYNKVI